MPDQKTIRTIAGSFGALLVGWLVVVVRGLYLARHLFTLFRHFVTWTLEEKEWQMPAK